MYMRRHAIMLVLLAFPMCAHAQGPSVELPDIYLGSEEYRLANRTALVVGVGSLKDKNGSGFINLKNPANDAQLISTVLEKAKFAVTNLNDVYEPGEMTRQNIKKALYDFALKLRSRGGVGLIYFSGHGLERNGRIYLVPHDAYIQFERDLDEELIPISLFYDAFTYAGNPLNLIILDACRDNPWKEALRQFGNPPGPMSATKIPDNVIMANATVSGGKAFDGDGEGSPYAKSFVATIKKADTGLSQFFDVIAREFAKLRAKQPGTEIPASPDRKGREFVFAPTIVTYNQEHESYKNATAAKNNRELLNTLVYQFPGGYFYKRAKDHLESWDFAPLVLAAARRQPAAAVSPKKVVALIEPARLRSMPSLKGTVKETRPAGALLTIGGDPVIDGNKKWISVESDVLKESLYVNLDNVRELAPKREVLPLKFVATSRPGVDALESESKTKIETTFKSERQPLITGVTIVGYNRDSESASAQDSLRVLMRQSLVIQALSEAGYDTSKAKLTSRSTEAADKVGSIELETEEVYLGTPG